MTALRDTKVDEYVAFCDGVRELCSVDLSQYKRGQMERRIRTFAERRGHERLTTYLGALEREPEELCSFLDRITINVSQLWRNPSQWALLRSEVIPRLAREGQLRAWSAGCSYGAEAYTLAAVCCTAAVGARVAISGTDIDRRMVERAREGIFSTADARDAPSDALARWFEPTPQGWVAGPELRRLVTFEVGDLLRLVPRPNAYDLILCRNTVIYFAEDVRDALHARLVDALRPGGYLMVGSTERVSDAAGLGLTLAHPFTYRKS